MNNSAHLLASNATPLELLNRRLTKEYLAKGEPERLQSREKLQQLNESQQIPKLETLREPKHEVTNRPNRQVASRADVYFVQRDAYLEQLETEYRKPYDEILQKLMADRDEDKLLHDVQSLKQAVASVIETGQIRKQTKEQAMALASTVDNIVN